MRSRVIAALILSCVLVGSALFSRFLKESSGPTIAQIAGKGSAPFVMEEIFTTVTPSTESEPLSQTDILSQDLFSDYMALKSSGNASEENIERLAEVYSSRVLASKKEVIVTPADLEILPDSEDNFLAYNRKTLGIRARYEVETQTLSGGGEFNSISDPNFTRLMEGVSALYAKAAGELKKLPVPVSLADNHARLINNYLSSSEATKMLATIEENPLEAFAALSTQASNSAEEELLFSNIRLLMIQKGFPNTL